MKIKIAEDVYVDANPDSNAEPSPLQLVKLADKLGQTYRLQGLAELVRQRAQDLLLQNLERFAPSAAQAIERMTK